MPKLFQICVGGNTGSTGRIAEQIGYKAIQNGWTSYIAYSRFPRPSKSNIVRIGTRLDNLKHGLISQLLDKQGFGSISATNRLIKKLKRVKPDIIHLHHLHGYYINIEILFHFLSKAEIQVVWTFHDCWSFTGHCAHFDYIGCEKWKIECHHCPQKGEYPRSIFVDRSRLNFRKKKELFTSVRDMTIVNVSRWLDSVVGSSFMGNISRIVIYNGIDLQTFKPQSNHQEVRNKYRIGEKFVILGVSGVWIDRKGLNDFIRLSEIISEDKVIVLVGLTKKQIQKLPKKIIGIERTENLKHLAELYSAADAYISLSVEETFGLTVAEALACGTPSIVYNATASPELINSDIGFVVEKGDLNGIVKAVEIIKQNGKNHYYSACRDWAVKRFDKEDCLKEYMKLYSRLITFKS